MNATRQPVLFISHGGGPWPYVDELRAMYVGTDNALRGLPERLPATPKAALVISGHWETSSFSVATASRPQMEYDYSGFPAHTYQISYPAPGNPGLAGHARDLIAAAGIDVATDPTRGFDHGVFVPLALMYPNADLPIVMVSIRSDYNPAAHLALGRSLAPLRDEGVLIVGSGLNYHNMRGFHQESATADADAFTQYLSDTVTLATGVVREAALARWELGPRARLSHPREDHLMPLLVAAGAAGNDRGQVLFTENVMRIPMVSYAFGAIKAD